MAYELKLPNDWRIHNVFHVSLLRKFLSDPNKLLQDLLQAMVEGKIIVEPKHILKTKMKKKGQIFYGIYNKVERIFF